MPFYQNPFGSEFRANLVLAVSEGKSEVLTYVVPPNLNNIGNSSVASNGEPYDFSATTDSFLTIRYFPDPSRLPILVPPQTPGDPGPYTGSVNPFQTIDVTLGGLTTATEVVSALNADADFAEYFEASVQNVAKNAPSVLIRAKQDPTEFTYYFENEGAEEALKFMASAGVAEIPSYFSRDTIAQAGKFNNAIPQLIELDPASSTSVDTLIIQEALGDPSWVPADLKEDWELLKGRSNLFVFKKQTVDGDDRLTESIEYPAGAVVGDLARKIELSYSGSDTTPFQITQVPYVLTSADLITP